MKTNRFEKTILKILLTSLILVVLSSNPAASPSMNASAAALLNPVIFLSRVQNGSLAPHLAGCDVFPVDNIWNKRIDSLPVNSKSSDWVQSIGNGTHLHPDFGANWNGGPFGIPYNVVRGSQPKVGVSFYYNSQSDPGPYPIPPTAVVEKGSDAHVLVLDSTKQSNNTWTAGSGAIFNLGSNLLRPNTWTSADAAGLPILPGLVRYDEVASGSIRHAIRFTANSTPDYFIWPARHQASRNSTPISPPFGARFRLKASVNISGFDPKIQVIFKAFKEYGLILADNGSDWYVSGVPDARWSDDLLVNAFNQLHGSDFEVVDESGLMIDANSGQSK